jgi:hypothetical protein
VLKRADQALYSAKSGGRNLTIVRPTDHDGGLPGAFGAALPRDLAQPQPSSAPRPPAEGSHI